MTHVTPRAASLSRRAARTARLLGSLSLIALAAACGSPSETDSKGANTQAAEASLPKVSFAPYLDGLNKSYFALNPENATTFGVPISITGEDVSSRINGYSPDEVRARTEALEAHLSALKSLPASQFDERGARLQSIFVTQLENALAPARIVDYGSALGGYGYWFLPYPVTHLTGPHLSIANTLDKQHNINTVSDAEAFLARVDAYSVAIDGVITAMEQDEAAGVLPPDFIIKKTWGSLERDAQTAKEHTLYNSFTKKIADAGLTEDEQADLTAQLVTLLDEHYIPANKRLIAKLKDMEQRADHTAGISAKPNGKALYQAMITHMTDTTMTAEQIHQIGLDEVARITGEMDAILKAQGMTEGSVGERMASLLTNERFLYPDTAEGKAKLLDDLRARRDAAMPVMQRLFETMPAHTVDIEAVPAHLEASAPGGFYEAAAADGSRPGLFSINLHSTAVWPSYTLPTLVYHETIPGHHLQIDLGLTLNAPVLSNILYSNAFAEGWALYSEKLMFDEGAYADDPFGNLGRLQAELHRSVRLVVDTGMHALGWSREDAIDYVVKTEGNHVDDATAEVERYVVWPGQALGYKVGALKIQELREKAQKALGSKFDIKAFHTAVLEDAGLPLNVLEAKIDTWIAANS